MTKILIIEDENILREEVEEWLTLEGYEVFTARDGVMGVELALQNLPDLILSDITMPGMNGYDVLMEIHSNPATATTPFIFVSARASYEDLRYGMEMGADDYITKPFTHHELLHTIRTRLDKKSAYERNYQQQIAELQASLELEREQRLLKAKLIAMLSHDFRNPLTSILASTELLRHYAAKMDDTRRLAHMDRIEASVRQLIQMMDDVLLVGKMETGNFELNLETVNLAFFFQEIVDSFRIIHRKTHQILFDSEQAGPVFADPRLLRQIAGNLISNAIKYSPHGSEVKIILEQGNTYFTLTVQDQGIGIPKADQPQLFGDYKRARNVGEIAGTGLGLAIVKQAMDLYGGEIHLDSEVGIGTSIRVTIPIQSDI